MDKIYAVIVAVTLCVLQVNAVTVSFERQSYTVRKTARPPPIRLILSEQLNTDVTIKVLDREGTAMRINDYTAGPYDVKFTAGVTRAQSPLRIRDDQLVEDNEHYYLIIDNSSLPNGVSLGTPSQATVTIIDDDRSVIFFNQTHYGVYENEGPAKLTLRLIGQIATDTIVQVKSNDGTAKGSDDYVSGPYNVTIPAEDTHVVFDIKIIDNNEEESDETFTISIDPSSLRSRLSVFMPGEATVTIMDDDEAGIISFKQATYSVDENVGVVQIMMVLDNPLQSDTTIIVNGNDNTATGNGEDYDSGPYTITILAQQTSVLFIVSITDDDVLEENEMFTLTIDQSSIPGHITVGDPAQVTVTIEDDDVLTVEFSQATFSGFEDSGFISVTLLLGRGTSSNDITVTVIPYDLLPGLHTAEGNDVDYDSSPINATFIAGTNSTTVNVTVIIDGVAERDELFNLNFTIPSSLKDKILFGDATGAVCTVVDNTITSVRFSEPVYNINEDVGLVKFSLHLSNPLSFNINVDVFNTNITALGGGIDYNSGPYPVTILAGETDVYFDVMINDDNILEGNETFNLTIDEPLLYIRVVAGNPATVTIVDNDVLTIRISLERCFGLEASGVISVTLVLEGGTASSDITVTVTPYDLRYLTSRSAKGNGVDYDSTPVNATFTAGTNSTIANISVITDNIAEDYEVFGIQLNFTDPLMFKHQIDLGSDNICFIDDNTITSVRFSEPVYDINEDVGLAQFSLLLSNPLSFNITVDVFNTNITALGEGIDYNSGPYPVTIYAGETAVYFDFMIKDDGILEGNETFNLTINGTSLPTQVIVGNPDQATVTIVDDDVLSVEFDQLTYAGLESSGVITVTLSLSGGTSTNDIIVTVIPSDQSSVSAEGGVDYDSTPINATFTAGTTRAMVNVPVTNDDIVEAPETFDLIFTIPLSLQGKVIPGAAITAVAIITDDDTTTVKFNQSVYHVIEDSGSAHPTLVLSYPLSSDITVDMFSTDITASGKGIDYDSGPYHVMVPANALSVVLNIPISSDDILEGNEKFNLTINTTSMPSRVVIGNPDQATVTIVDDDDIDIMFSEATYSTNENGSTVQLMLVLSRPSSTPITVQITDHEVTATRGDDYIFERPYNVEIPVGHTTIQFNIQIVNDSILEENEYFIVIIDTDSLPSGITLGNPGTTSVSIVDNDAATVSFNKSAYRVNEGDGPVQPVLVLSNPSSFVITVQVTDTNNTATGHGIDYASGPYDVILSAGTTTASFDVPIISDNILENDEEFTLTINPSSLPSNVSVGIFENSTITVVDDDDSTVFFGQSIYSVLENIATIKLTLNLSKPLSRDINVTIEDNGNTATGDDYDSGPYDITFTAGTTSSSFTITINDDNTFEDNESFVVTITSLPSIINVGSPRQATVTIIDDDEIKVHFSNDIYSGSEESGIVSVTLSLEGGISPFAITVTVVPSDQSLVSAEGNGTDYSSTPINATFAADSSSTTVNVSVIKDDIVEPSETFNLNIIIPSSLSSRVLPGRLNASIGRITDSTVLMVEFSQSAYSGSEASGVVPIMLLLRGGTSTSDITVTVTLSDITAKGGEVDYNSTPINAIFIAGSTIAELNIMVIMDDVAEESETFNLTFTTPSSLNGKIVPGNIRTAIGTITDNTATSVKFDQSAYSVNERNEKVQIVLVLSNPSSTIITVEVLSTDGSATDADYQSRTHVVKFLAGMINASFDVAIANDSILEVDENFELIINMSSLPNDVTIGVPGRATVTIVDDDEATISFNQTMYSVKENDGPAQPVIVLSNPSSTDITVEVIDNSNTAMVNDDYDSGPYTVTIPAKQTYVRFDVSIRNDDTVERNENFNLIIDPQSLPNGVTSGIHGMTTVVIVNDDMATVFFNESTYSVNENEGSVRPVLVLSNPSSTDVIVHVIDSDGTAMGTGKDYSSGPYKVTFPAGVTQIEVNVPITNDDQVEEKAENFSLSINSSSLPMDITVGNPDQATVTIVDDDVQSVEFFGSTFFGSEKSGFVTASLLLRGGTAPNDITVVVKPSDQLPVSAKGGGVDYISDPINATFSAGTTDVYVAVPVIKDTIVEGLETFNLNLMIPMMPTNKVILGKVATAVGTITDSTVIMVQFSHSTFTGDEASGVLRVTLSLVGGTSAVNFTVTVIPSDQSPPSAKGNGVDYDSTPITTTFPAGATNIAINIPVTKDTIVEESEMFDLNFTISSSLNNQIIPGSVTKATAVINDNTDNEVYFDQTMYTFSESETIRAFLLLSNPSSTDVTIQVLHGDITAVGGDDYAPGPYSVLFPAGQINASLDISIVDDNVLESEEQFALIIGPSQPSRVTVGSPSQATVTIEDNDDTAISFEQSEYSVNENDGRIQLVLVLRNPASTDIDAQVISTDTLATGRNDYTPGPFNVKFPAGVTNASLYISIIDDETFEKNEEFLLTILQTSLPSDVHVGATSQATVTIVDDDVAAVFFEQQTYKINEHSGYVQAVLRLNVSTSFNFTIRVVDNENTARGSGEDYISGPFNIEISPGQTTATINVTIIDNEILEFNETFDLMIIDGLPDGVILGNPNRTTITIVDDDIVTVNFNESTYTVGESDGSIQLLLILSNPISTTITVVVETTMDTGMTTATGGEDYSAGPYDVTFMAGEIQKEFTVLIIGDSLLEGNEEVEFSISNNLPDKISRGTNFQTRLTILDDDVATIAFNASRYSVNEHDLSVHPVLVISKPLSTDWIIQVFSSDISTNDKDYITGPYNVKVPAGMKDIDFNITINNDKILEINEAFTLTIDPLSLPNDVSIDDQDTATVTIVDDDIVTVNFTRARYRINENKEFVQVSLVFDNPSSADINVTVVTEDGSAFEGGVDYHSGPYHIIFTSGITQAAFNISITDDNILEENENFVVTIDGSSLPLGVVVGGNNQARVIIRDDETATVSFNESSYSVDEASGLVQPVLILSNPSSSDVVVQVREREHTADRGKDYAPGRYTTVFPAGMTSTLLNITITIDDVFERDERFDCTVVGATLPDRISLGDVRTTTVTIFDVVSVKFEQTEYTVVEGGDSVTLSVALNSTLKSGITFIVEIATRGGSATGGDYESRPYSLSFSQGINRISFKVLILDDDIYEDIESFHVTIDPSSLPSDVIVDYPSEVTVFIMDNDAPTVGFEEIMYSIDESDTVQPVLVLSNPSSFDIAVQVFTMDGSATGYDYEFGIYNNTFSTEVTRIAFNVPVNDDNIFEGNENFTLIIDQFSLPKNVTVVEPNKTATVTIVDNDAPTVRFERPAYYVNEYNQSVYPVLLLSNPSTTNIIVMVSTMDGSATGFGSDGSGVPLEFIGVGSGVALEMDGDYDPGLYTVMFNAGETEKSFQLSIIDDDVFEGNENFNLTINSTSPSVVSIGDPNQAKVTILDDDPINISFNESSYTVGEEVTSLQLVLLFSNPSSTSVTVQVVNINNSATGGIDYLSGPYTVEFDAGATKASFAVSIINDNVSESDENFILSIDNSSLPMYVSADDPGQATVTILDDDSTTVFFSISQYIFNENNTAAQLVLFLSKPSSTDVTIQVITYDITAIGGGTDYSDGPYNATFPAGQTHAVFHVLINDDNIVESSEKFSLNISSSSLLDGVTVGSANQVTVTIEDDDETGLEGVYLISHALSIPKTTLINALTDVYFNQSTYYVNENDEEVQAVLALSNPSSSNVTVEIIVNSITAVDVNDYDSGPYTVEFPAGSTNVSFGVKIVNDGITEDNENFTLIINSSSVPIGYPDQATVTIVDDDAIAVHFNESSYTVNEDIGELHFALFLSNPSSTEITVNVFTTNGLAVEENVDYVSGPYSAIFTAGNTSTSFSVTIIDDNVTEGHEHFILTINSSSIPENVAIGHPNQITVTIVDDDVPTVSFMESTYSFTENNGVGQVGLVLGKPAAIDITVQVINNNGTALGGGIDYISGPYIVTIPAGDTNIVLNVSINDDNMLEGNESFYLTINSTFVAQEIIVDNPGVVTVTIVDDEVGTISFEQSGYSINENDDQPLQPVLVLSHPLSMDITVQVINNDNSAAGGSDYMPGPYMVDFSAGMTRASFPISVINDLILEDNEDFVLTINSSSLPEYVNNLDQATVTIIDDDVAAIFFKQSRYNVRESEGAVDLELTLSNPLSFDITVNFNDIGNTANKGEDYRSGPYSTVIPAEMTSMKFSVMIMDDDILENNEKFDIAIDQSTLPIQVTAISPHQVTVTIMDDENVTVSFNQSSYNVNENDGLVQPVLYLSHQSSFDVKVRVRTANRAAEKGKDYDTDSRFVTFPPGVTHVSFNVTIINDYEVEGNETFQLVILLQQSNKRIMSGKHRRVTFIIIDDDKVIEPPANVTATVLTSHSAEVTWDQSTSSDITGYLISYTTNALYASGGNVTVIGGNATSHTLNDLEENTPYNITVQTVRYGVISASSNEVSITTYTDIPSSPPLNIMITGINPASLMISWQPPLEKDRNGPITGYIIQYTRVGSDDMMSENASSAATVHLISGAATVYTLSGLVAYVNYSVSVAAMTVNGTGPLSDPVVGRSGEDVPSEPRSLMVVNITDTTVTLSWISPDPPNGIIIGYQVQYRRDNSSDLISLDTNDIALNYTVTGLTNNVDYVFSVRAYTAAGYGAYSSEVTARARNCTVNEITGGLEEKGSDFVLVFSGGHPDTTYRCKINNGDFEPCVSPVILRKGYRTVTVRAYCFVDGEYEQQKRRKFSPNL